MIEKGYMSEFNGMETFSCEGCKNDTPNNNTDCPPCFEAMSKGEGMVRYNNGNQLDGRGNTFRNFKNRAHKAYDYGGRR